MNGFSAHKSLYSCIKETLLIGGGRSLIINYLYHLRRYAFYYNNHKRFLSWNTIMMFHERYWFTKLGIRCGFSIGTNSLGYGVVIPHYGTIVINEDSKIGNYCVLHTSTCVAGGGKLIGDGLYLSTGSQIVGNIKLGNAVTVAAHSLVNKSYDSNILLVGSPAIIKRMDYNIWYETDRDKDRFNKRIRQIEELKKQIYG